MTRMLYLSFRAEGERKALPLAHCFLKGGKRISQCKKVSPTNLSPQEELT
jgi:hypothetical protein